MLSGSEIGGFACGVSDVEASAGELIIGDGCGVGGLGPATPSFLFLFC